MTAAHSHPIVSLYLCPRGCPTLNFAPQWQSRLIMDTQDQLQCYFQLHFISWPTRGDKAQHVNTSPEVNYFTCYKFSIQKRVCINAKDTSSIPAVLSFWISVCTRTLDPQGMFILQAPRQLMQQDWFSGSCRPQALQSARKFLLLMHQCMMYTGLI